jgi:hypothetical protein
MESPIEVVRRFCAAPRSLANMPYSDSAPAVDAEIAFAVC